MLLVLSSHQISLVFTAVVTEGRDKRNEVDRTFIRENPRLRRSPTSSRLLSLSAMISQYFMRTIRDSLTSLSGKDYSWLSNVLWCSFVSAYVYQHHRSLHGISLFALSADRNCDRVGYWIRFPDRLIRDRPSREE